MPPLRASEHLRRVLDSQAPAIRDAVIDGFAFKPDDFARVATPETLDQIITNSLALRLDDPAFADELYRDIRDQAVGAAERWHDASTSIRITPDPEPTPGQPLFVVIIRTEYTVVPQYATRRFICVSDKTEYRELAQDLANTSVWYLKPKPGVDAGSRRTFELVQFSVNGTERPIRRAKRPGGQAYTVNLGQDIIADQQAVRVSYTYRTLHPTARQPAAPGHRATHPRHHHGAGLQRQPDHRRQRARLLRQLPPSPRHAHPTSVPGKSVSIDFDGWVFPRSGVAFVWTTAPAVPQDRQSTTKTRSTS